MRFSFLPGIVPVLGVICFAGEKKISVADCRFANEPDEYLSRAARIRIQINASIKTLGDRLTSQGRTVSADSIPKRNFIDEEIFGKLTRKGVESAPLATDEEFFRRIHLDLTGRLPTSDDIRAFLADAKSSKRNDVIDRLVRSPEFTDRWTMWMGDLLQNTATLVNAAANRNNEGRNAFHAYIQDAIGQDKSFRTIATEVITAKGNNYQAPEGAANFPMGASTAMGPIQDTYDTMLVKTATTFLGLSAYDCLLCHNGRGRLHLSNLWGTSQSRVQAQSMAAFFSRMRFTASTPRGSFIVTDGFDGAYELDTDSGNRPNRVPVGNTRTLTPAYRETDAAPADGDWRAAFAQNMVDDPMFGRNLANRLWKQIFGMGLVEPVDSLDPARLNSKNPPAAPWELQATHPELLEKLAAALAEQDFQLRAFLRMLTKSSAYQLSSRYGGEWSEDHVPLFARRFARRLEAEEVHDAVAKATGILADYRIQASSNRVNWAMQLPDTIEPTDAVARNFLNTFLRGDRDTQERSQAGSIQQQLFMMNDAFVADRISTERSSKLRFLTEIKNDEAIEELYLTFLSRRPTDAERASGVAYLAKASNRAQAMEDMAWMCVNKTEFLFSY